MQNIKQTYTDILILALLGAIFFLPFLGGVHLFDWDEINFAECAREMVVSGNYLQVQMDFQPFYEKPPLFFWLQAAAMQIFGIGEYAARFPNAVCGIITIALLYCIGRREFSRNFGLLWAMAYIGSLLPHLYFKSGIIDPWFNLFIFSGLYALFVYKKNNYSKKYLAFSGLCIGLAILTKGPVALLIYGLCVGVYTILNKWRLPLRWTDIFLLALCVLIFPALWFGVETAANGPEFVQEFIIYQIRLLTTHDAGHKGFPGFHVVVLLVGCFPASVFALQRLFGKTNMSSDQNILIRWMRILFWVVLILFSIVQSKIVHYSSLCYFPITFLAALALIEYSKEKKATEEGTQSTLQRRGLPVLFPVLGTIIACAALLLPYLGMRPDRIRSAFSLDAFTSQALHADIHWTGWDYLPGIGLLIIICYFALYWRSNHRNRIFALFLCTALFTSAAIIAFVKKIEGYSQRAVIEFYEGLQDKDVYTKTIGFKSYAHIFYAASRAPEEQTKENSARPLGWYIHEDIDKDVYFVRKVTNGEMEKIKGLKEIGRKNGFVFYVRQF